MFFLAKRGHELILCPKHGKFIHTQANARVVLQEIGSKIGIKTFSEWYRVTPKDIEENGGGSILRIVFGNNHIQAITSAFPEYEWKEWLFSERVSPLGDLKYQKKILFEIGERLKISHIEDWYSVSSRDILKQVRKKKYFII